MNVIKYRPVGRPSAPVVRIRVSQCKRAICAHKRGERADALSVARADKLMLAKGYVRAGVRHGK